MSQPDAFRLYVRLRFFSALFFSMIVTVNLVYQAVVVGLDPLQLVLVGTLLEAVCFLFEIPTGVVADLYSRKLSVVVGLLLMGIGFMVEGSFPIFPMVLLAQAIWGIGATFVSGAREAWIADEAGEVRAGEAFLSGQKAQQLGAFGGILLGVVLASIDLRLPIVLGGALYCLLALYLLGRMPEHNFRPTPPRRRETFGAMRDSFHRALGAVRADRALAAFVLIGMLLGAFSEGFDRLWTPFLLADFAFPALGNFPPVVWFGAISLVATLLAAVLLAFIDRRTDTDDRLALLRALFLISTLLPAAVVVLAGADSFAVAAGAYCFAYMLKEGIGPLSDCWINRQLEPRVRATVFSFASQMNSLGQVAGGPLLGWIAAAVSLRMGLVAAALFSVPVFLFYGYLLHSGRTAGKAIEESS